MPEFTTADSTPNRSLRELGGIVALAVTFFFVSTYLDWLEWLAPLPFHRGNWHIPELAGAIIIASIGLIVLVIRRCNDLGEANSRLSNLCRDLEREKAEMQILSQMTDLLQSCLTVEESSRIIGRTGHAAFPNQLGGVFLFKSSRNVLEPGGVWGETEGGVRDSSFSPNDCWALRRGLPHIREGSPSPRCAHLDVNFTGWSLCVPLAAMGETIGVLHLRAGQAEAGPVNCDESTRHARVESFAVRFAAAASTALANLNLRETLRYQSIRDPLTGLYNRRYLEDLLNVEIGRAVRKMRPLSVIMLDADHFKKFNDSFGHEAGDKVLRTLAAVLTKVVRKEDLACRYGGEEFILVLPEATQEIAFARAGRMREEVRRMAVNHDGRCLGPVTVSAGVASFPDHAATADALVQAADAALYQAKAQGRDRVVLAGSPPSDPADDGSFSGEDAPHPVKDQRDHRPVE